ncbi:MAG: hypothetical protein IH973_05285 [Myxococcales bacterium]|nr:hypothetical protein [Myxococcales bacterium]
MASGTACVESVSVDQRPGNLGVTVSVLDRNPSWVNYGPGDAQLSLVPADDGSLRLALQERRLPDVGRPKTVTRVVTLDIDARGIQWVRHVLGFALGGPADGLPKAPDHRSRFKVWEGATVIELTLGGLKYWPKAPSQGRALGGLEIQAHATAHWVTFSARGWVEGARCGTHVMLTIHEASVREVLRLLEGMGETAA